MSLFIINILNPPPLGEAPNPTKENKMSEKILAVPSTQRKIKDLLTKRELINKQIQNLLSDIISIEELVQIMLELNLTQPEAIEYMRSMAKEA
tara:strand:- start:118 stop:396 length:279 start_codon:yes stop_codon:yes gene_type:complete